MLVDASGIYLRGFAVKHSRRPHHPKDTRHILSTVSSGASIREADRGQGSGGAPLSAPVSQGDTPQNPLTAPVSGKKIQKPHLGLSGFVASIDSRLSELSRQVASLPTHDDVQRHIAPVSAKMNLVVSLSLLLLGSIVAFAFALVS